MNRVIIMGCPGAGKSTAAKKLAEITGLPIIHLDRHYWLPGWIRPDQEVWRATVHDLACRPRWIMDGNYSGTLDIRIAEADTIIHLDFSTSVCIWRVARRTVTRLGRQRDQELPDECPERMDWSFFRFVLRYRRYYRARDMERLKPFDGVVHRFTSPMTLKAFLAKLAQGS